MLTAVLLVATLAVMTALMLAAAAASRWLVVRALGVRGVPFPFGASGRWCWATRSAGPQALGYLGSLAGMYAVSAAIVAAGTWGAWVDPPDAAGMRLEVDPGGPADVAGIRDGDRVDKVNGEPVTSWDALRDAIARHPRGPLDVAVTRDGREVHAEVTPDGSGAIRVQLPTRHTEVGLGAALLTGAASPALFLFEQARSIVRVVSGSARGELVGPVGIVGETRRQAKLGTSVVFVGLLGAYMLPFLAIGALFTGPGRRRPVVRGRAQPGPLSLQ